MSIPNYPLLLSNQKLQHFIFAFQFVENYQGGKRQLMDALGTAQDNIIDVLFNQAVANGLIVENVVDETALKMCMKQVANKVG